MTYLKSLTALAFAAFATTAAANTVDDIKNRGVAVIGVQMDQFPWGFINEQGQNEGYDVEIARMIAEELGVEPRFERITGQNRIPLLVGGMVDFLVPSMTITQERAKVIQFALPYSANDITLWARTDADIAGNDDLTDYIVGVNRGSAFEPILVQNAPPGTEIKRYDDDATTVQALLSGQVDAILGSVTYGLVIDNTGNGENFGPKYKMADNFQAMAVRLGDRDMLNFLNDFVTRRTEDGTLDALYKKWIGLDRPTLPTELPGVNFRGE